MTTSAALLFRSASKAVVRPSRNGLIDELIDACDRLAKLALTARIGSPAPHLGDGIRLFSQRRWVLIFRYLDDGALILRIVDGSQDYMYWTFE